MNMILFPQKTVMGDLPAFPTISFCQSSKIKCTCSLWYDDLVIDNLNYTYPILANMCPKVTPLIALVASLVVAAAAAAAGEMIYAVNSGPVCLMLTWSW